MSKWCRDESARSRVRVLSVVPGSEFMPVKFHQALVVSLYLLILNSGNSYARGITAWSIGEARERGRCEPLEII